MKKRGADIIVETMIRNGVDTVFGYPGGTVLPIYDALRQNQDRIKHVISAHEQGACHAADGYARASGKAGVVIATSGPGATNITTGIAAAFMDSVPLVAITGNVISRLIGTDSFQEVDYVDMTQGVVKHSYMIRHISELEEAMDSAFKIAQSGRKGPVLLDIAQDVQVAETDYIGTDVEILQKDKHFGNFDEAVQAISQSKRPLIYAGGGVIAANATEQLLQLAEKLNAPVTLSAMGITAMPSSHPLNLGFSGMHGKFSANKAQSEFDVMIAVGVRFSDRATGDTKMFLGDKTIIHIDIDIAEIEKNIGSQINICSDAKTALTKLNEQCEARQNKHWLAQIEEFKADDPKVNKSLFIPENILKEAGKNFGAETVVTTDVGQHQMWTLQFYPFEKPRTMLTSGGMGAMGYGMGAAIGASIAKGKSKTVLVTGDGSFSMNLNEMATAVSQELPIVVLLLNNNALGMVKQLQTIFFEKKHYQTTNKLKTDFPLLAKAFGGEGYRVSTMKELEEVLKKPVTKPTVIECMINEEELVLPMIPPGKSVKDIILNY